MRTNPQPYDAAKSHLSALLQVSSFFQGSDLVFRWKVPAKGITSYRLSEWQAEPNCLSCPKSLLTRVLLYPKTDVVDLEITSIPRPTGGISYTLKDGTLHWLFPSTFFETANGDYGKSITIDYVRLNGEISKPSHQIIPVRPLPIPIPEISVVRLVQPTALATGDQDTDVILIQRKSDPEKGRGRSIPMNSFLPLDPPQDKKKSDLTIVPHSDLSTQASSVCRDLKIEFMLILNWTPRQEAIRHRLQLDGSIAEVSIAYGVNLYRVKKGSQGNLFELINAEPLVDGSFSLVNFTDLLYARHQDRFGNESEAVLIFDGTYQ